jgi:hypothetical protein
VALAFAAGFGIWALAGGGGGEGLDAGPAAGLLGVALVQALPFLVLAALSRLLSGPGQLLVLALAAAALLLADLNTAGALSEDPLQFLGFVIAPVLVTAGVLVATVVDALGRWGLEKAGRADREGGGGRSGGG